MRLLYTFNNDRYAKAFSAFLKQDGIQNLLDITPNNDWGSENYGTPTCNVWVVDEDQVAEANQRLEQFLKNPTDAKFQKFNKALTPPPPPEAKKTTIVRKTAIGRVTLFLIILCSLIFIATELTTPHLDTPAPNLPPSVVYLSPIKKALLFDFPEKDEILEKVIKAYGINKIQDLPPEGNILIAKFARTPAWEGFYDKLILFFTEKKPITIDAPLFEKIKQGEIWRSVTPILLHMDILHIFFNMIWLLVIGTQIEKRIGPFRYIFFILVTAVFSNILQYLMSGPNFIGFSGVVCAMIVFVWFRQKKAPWEGYQILPSTMNFITIFVLGMLGIQIFSFFLQIMGQAPLPLIIANTAHIAGGIAGLLLAQLKFFAWKSR